MKFIASLAVIVVLSLASFGQTAKVVALDKADSDKAKHLTEEKARIEKELADLESSIVVKYLAANGGKESNCINADGVRVREGWACGYFQFSDDFKYIVPVAVPLQNSQPIGSWALNLQSHCSGNVCW